MERRPETLSENPGIESLPDQFRKGLQLQRENHGQVEIPHPFGKPILAIDLNGPKKEEARLMDLLATIVNIDPNFGGEKAKKLAPFFDKSRSVDEMLAVIGEYYSPEIINWLEGPKPVAKNNQAPVKPNNGWKPRESDLPRGPGSHSGKNKKKRWQSRHNGRGRTNGNHSN